ncbi:hypothetical protein L1887_31889 [Cichorium endivia]|nr:hypothetical protein L1887_31889 [Cichorium endivia]
MTYNNNNQVRRNFNIWENRTDQEQRYGKISFADMVKKNSKTIQDNITIPPEFEPSPESKDDLEGISDTFDNDLDKDIRNDENIDEGEITVETHQNTKAGEGESTRSNEYNGRNQWRKGNQRRRSRELEPTRLGNGGRNNEAGNNSLAMSINSISSEIDKSKELGVEVGFVMGGTDQLMRTEIEGKGAKNC